jgi:hypothetical protein
MNPDDRPDPATPESPKPAGSFDPLSGCLKVVWILAIGVLVLGGLVLGTCFLLAR